MNFEHEIIKGSANYLLCCLNYEAEDGRILSAAEQVAEFGPCVAVAWAPTKKALVKLCKDNGLTLKA